MTDAPRPDPSAPAPLPSDGEDGYRWPDGCLVWPAVDPAGKWLALRADGRTVLKNGDGSTRFFDGAEEAATWLAALGEGPSAPAPRAGPATDVLLDAAETVRAGLSGDRAWTEAERAAALLAGAVPALVAELGRRDRAGPAEAEAEAEAETIDAGQVERDCDDIAVMVGPDTPVGLVSHRLARHCRDLLAAWRAAEAETCGQRGEKLHWMGLAARSMAEAEGLRARVAELEGERDALIRARYRVFPDNHPEETPRRWVYHVGMIDPGGGATYRTEAEAISAVRRAAGLNLDPGPAPREGEEI